MRWIALRSVFIIWLGAAGATCSVAHAITITDPQPATPAEQLARQELTAYLARMQPARWVIRTTGGEVLPTEIVVCRQDSAANADIKPPLPKLPPEGYALALRGSRICLVGADDRAVLYAVYDFLHRLGCRWLAPAFAFYKGEHEYVPQLAEATLSLSEDVICKPALKFRKLYVEEGHSHSAENLRQMVAWMPKLRFNTLVIPVDYQGRGQVRWDNWRVALTPQLQARGITIEVGGHGYQNYLNATMDDGRLFRKHPEWFAMDARGQRTKSPGWVLCSSNPQAVARLQQNVVAYLKAHPEIAIFDFWPPDGARWCTCDSCKALGGFSERHARLVSQMASALHKELPNVRLECIAYSSYLEPPDKNPIDKSVLVDFCPISQSFETQIDDAGNKHNAPYVKALKAWLDSFGGDLSIYSYYRKYAWASRPNIIPHYMQNDLRFYRKAGVKGISSYAEPGDWFTYELNHYVLGHLAWDEDLDVDAIIREFCEARYQGEAPVARGVFETLEAVVRHACHIPGTSMKTPAEYNAFIARLDEQRHGIAEALERPQASAARSAHLHRLDLMLEYASRDIAIQRQQASQGPVADRRGLIDGLIAFLRQHADEGVFVWHSRMEPQRQYKEHGIVKE